MNKFSRISFLAIIAISASFALSGCVLMQSTVAGATSGWWGRTGDDNYDSTKIQPVYCYSSLSSPECYAEPLPEGSNRKLIGAQYPYKSAKQIADEKEVAAQQNPGGYPPEANPDNNAATEPAANNAANAAQELPAKKNKKKPDATNNKAGLAVPKN